MVIGTSPINEYDRRVVLLTKERGKITALPEGQAAVQRHAGWNSAFFCFGTFRDQYKCSYPCFSGRLPIILKPFQRKSAESLLCILFSGNVGYYARGEY